MRVAIGATLSALLLSACATGQGSFVAGSGGGGGDDEFFADDEGFFDENAPDLLAAGGNALLPGSRNRNRASAALLGQTVGGENPLVNGAINSTGGALTGALNNSLNGALNGAPLTGPLLALNGRRTVLLGLPLATNNLGVRTQSNVTLGASVNPSNASTQLLISLGGAVASPTGGTTTIPTTPINTGTPPIVPPVTTPVTSPPPLIAPGVPGSVPLTSLLPLLPTPGGSTGSVPGIPGH